METITQYGAFTKNIADQINQNFGQAGFGFPTGNIIYLDPFNGSDFNNGSSPTNAYATLAGAYAAGRNGKNDVIALISNGLTTSSARLGANFTWSKNALHLMGVCAPSRLSQRARITPVSGVTAFANFFTVSGAGCMFQNIEWFDGFATGTTNQIALAVSGAFNAFLNCHIAGMGDAASAADTGSRSLVVSAGENFFGHCVIGLDTIASSVLNASVEFKTGAARNVFEDCIFPRLATTAAAGLVVLTAGSASIDRATYFRRCTMVNAAAFSGGAAGTGAIKMAASSGGVIVLQGTQEYGWTDWGYDATSKAQIVTETAGTTSGSGIMIVNT